MKEWKERRSDEMRELILDSASAIFNEKGFERSTTKEIAQHTGVSEGTLYNYFENKREILLSLVRRFAGAASSLFRNDIGSDIRERGAPEGLGARYFLQRLQVFRQGLSPTLVFYHAKRDPDVRELLRKFWGDPLNGNMRPQIEELQRQGIVRDINLDFVGAFVRAIVFGLATIIDIESPALQSPFSLEELSKMARDVIWYGLSAPGRREQ